MATIIDQPHYIISSQPQAQVIVHDDPFKQYHNEWSVGLCDCCDDIEQCCYAYLCWCCFLGSLARKIDESLLSCCCIPNVLTVYRMKVRSILKIRGNACNDFCVVCWFPFCAGLQMRNELRNYELGL